MLLFSQFDGKFQVFKYDLPYFAYFKDTTVNNFISNSNQNPENSKIGFSFQSVSFFNKQFTKILDVGEQKNPHFMAEQSQYSDNTNLSDQTTIPKFNINKIDTDKLNGIQSYYKTAYETLFRKHEGVLVPKSPQYKEKTYTAQIHDIDSQQYKIFQERIQKLESRIAELQFENETLQKRNKISNDQVTKYHKFAENLIIEKSKLEHLIQSPNLDIIDNFLKTHKPLCGSQFGWELLREMIHNFVTQPNKHRFSKEFKKFGFVIHNLSPRSYNFMQLHWPVPVFSVIYEFTKDNITNLEKNLLDGNHIRRIIEEAYSHCLKAYKYGDRLKVSLAVDAIALVPESLDSVKKSIGAVPTEGLESQMRVQKIEKQEAAKSDDKNKNSEDTTKSDNEEDDEFEKEQKKKRRLNNMFICYLEPFDANYPCVPIHLIISNSGEANEDIRKEIQQLIKILRGSAYVTLVNFTTDGDQGH